MCACEWMYMGTQQVIKEKREFNVDGCICLDLQHKGTALIYIQGCAYRGVHTGVHKCATSVSARIQHESGAHRCKH